MDAVGIAVQAPPPIVAGDFNGTPALPRFDTTINYDVDYILVGKTSKYRSVFEPAAETERTPTESPNPDHCGAIATLLSDHCATFAQYLPVQELPSLPPLPNVVGDTKEDALSVLRAAGFVVAERETIDRSCEKVGVVLGQSPQAGMQLPPGETVTIDVAVEPDDTRCP
jgi:hypothetical protein